MDYASGKGWARLTKFRRVGKGVGMRTEEQIEKSCSERRQESEKNKSGRRIQILVRIGSRRERLFGHCSFLFLNTEICH